MGFANLHTHTYFSDGRTSPEELVRHIYNEKGLETFALTDHDTLSGIEPAYRIKRQIESESGCRKKEKRFIPGIELSLHHKGIERAAQFRYGELPKLKQELDEATEALKRHQDEHGVILSEEVGEEDIARSVSRWTGIPVTRLMEGEKSKLLQMEDRIQQRVVGQDDAVGAVAAAVRRARAGLKDPNRPIGSFLFLGPTGVGKTELARALAEFLFDDERAMIRIDMSEYMEKHSVARMIGAPPGYVGYDEGGQLTEAVRRRPYSVVLLDEIEKAHADVFNVLLQILDDGRLTDGKGRTVDFRNTVVIMTSNIGSHVIQDLPESERERMVHLVQDQLKQNFRPEFLNRVDEVLIFHRLSQSHMNQIVHIQLKRLNDLLAQQGLAITATDVAAKLLAREGFDPDFGARPLKRAIQRLVQDPLANMVLAGDVSEGQIIELDVQGGELVLTPSTPQIDGDGTTHDVDEVIDNEAKIVG